MAACNQTNYTIGSPERRVFILVTHVYTRERHENKNTRFWATYDYTGMLKPA